MTEAVASGSRTSPYQGLRSFNEEDAEFFFGRDEERDVVIANLKASRLTVLYGPSGVGKSSLLGAGVMAELANQATVNQVRLGSPEFLPVIFRAWRDDPSLGLSAAIAEAVTRFTGVSMMPEGSLAETIVGGAKTADATILVILDQFEDLSLYHGAQNGAGAFPAEFPGLVNDRRLPVNFLVSIREDALAQLDRFRDAIPWMLDTRLRIRPLSGEAASAAITGPLARFNELCARDARVEIEDELVSAVLDQVRTGQVAFDQGSRGAGAEETEVPTGPHEPARIETPYLQLVMSTVWEHEASHGSRVLRLSTLNALGGAQEIVRTHLDGVLGALPADQQELAADIFDHLVTPSGTKIALRISDLVAYSDRPVEQVERLVERLESGEQRILRPVPPPPGVDEAPGAEIFHDVLAPAITAWCTRQHSARLEREKREAEEDARRERRRARISTVLAASALAALVLAVAGYVYANAQRAQASQARNTARSQVLGSDALADYQRALGRGLLLAVQAYRTAPTSEARGALVGGLVKTEGMVGYLKAHDGAVNAVAFDPGTDLLASGSTDGTVVLWNFDTGRQRTLTGRSQGVTSVAFSSDGRTVAAATYTGAVNLWDVGSGRPLPTLSGNAGQVYGVAFAPDGTIVASANQNGSVILWSIASGRPLRTLVGHGGAVNAVAFSPDGRTIATAQDNGATMLWDVATGRRLHTLSGDHHSIHGVAFGPHGRTIAIADGGWIFLWNAVNGQPLWAVPNGATVESVAFSPDGNTVVSGGDDNAVRTWDAATGHLLRTFLGHTGIVQSVAFSPRGDRIASGSSDESVILWDATPSGAARTLNDNHQAVYNVAFGGNASTLAAANQDGTVSLWHLGTRTHERILRPRIGAVESVAFTRDGKELAAAGNDGSVVVWDAASGARRLRISDHSLAGLTRVAFNPDGTSLAAASATGDVFVWDAATGKLLRDLHGQAGVVNAVAFDPQGATLASAGADGTIVLWDLSTGERLRTLSGSGAAVYDVAFSPGGRLLASASDDQTVTLWDLRSGRGTTLKGHQDRVYSVAFGPHGRTLASGGADRTVIIWNLGTGLGEPLGGHTDVVTSVAYSPDGKLLAAAGADGTIVLYSSPPTIKRSAAIYQRLCRVVRSNLTHAEWRVFLPGVPYQKTCPAYP